jgi:N-acetylmuramoyl-L-alanine amidase
VSRAHPGSRSVSQVFLTGALAATVLAGCSTRLANPYFATTEPAVITSPDPQTFPEVLAVPDVTAPVIGHDVFEPPSTNTNVVERPVVTLAAPIPATSTRWGTGWVSLERFAAECGLGKAERSIVGNTSRYSIQTRGGPISLTIGTKLAKINGINVWLGFAPQVIRGKPCVNALDVEKTLQPLSAATLAISAPTKTLVLDAGHGGADAGTRGIRGEREKDFTLDWALRAEKLLTNAGWRVVLTRRTDVDVPLLDRIAVAERARADLFISLHFNSAAPHPGPSGVETYCLTPTGEASTLARGYADDARAVFPNNSYDRGNIQLAARLHRSLVSHTHALDGGVRHARFMTVLRGQNRPAILIEGGYLSSPAEMSNIASANYRQRLAEALAQAME